MLPAEGVSDRHECTKRSPRFCDSGNAFISDLAIEATDTKESLNKWDFRARYLVCRRYCIFQKRDHQLTLYSETAFSIIRLVEITSLSESDVTWNYLPPIIWSSVEICVGMFCACLPVMAPLVPIFLRGRSGPKESHDSSSFHYPNPRKVTSDFARQKFNRLKDDTTDSVLGSEGQMGIRQTTDIDVREEDNIEMHTMA